jgi:hypothetical protein
MIVVKTNWPKIVPRLLKSFDIAKVPFYVVGFHHECGRPFKCSLYLPPSAFTRSPAAADAS